MEVTGNAHFPKNCFHCRKKSSESDQYHVPLEEVQEEQLVVYQLLPNLTILEDFEWPSSGSEPVNM